MALVRVTNVRITNFRSVVELPEIPLGQVTVLIGPNNAGKSTILRALYAVQAGVGSLNADVRLDAEKASIELTVIDPTTHWPSVSDVPNGRLTLTIQPGELRILLRHSGGENELNQLPAQSPGHYVVPYLSKRKAVTYNEDVREEYALSVDSQFTHLAAKLSRLGNPEFSGHAQYARSCRDILGFVVTAVPSVSGQRPGVYLPDMRTIPIEQMGEGVPNIVGLLADLALSRGKLFLLEEPENDLHPSALKALLDLVLESAEHNQFVVSTHSHIVTKHLAGGDGSRLYYVDAERHQLPPETHVRAVEATPTARLDALRELGYAFSDFELWDGWLILEEASAERIIRDYLVKYFAPALTRLRTLSAGSNSQVEPTFVDFHRLVRFTHLEEAYRNRAWVLVDGDEDGRAIVESLRAKFPTWEPEQFACFDSATFEAYYPSDFRAKADATLAVANKRDRREAKRLLLDEVRAWLDADEDRARAELETSASTVIAALRQIEARLLGQ